MRSAATRERAVATAASWRAVPATLTERSTARVRFWRASSGSKCSGPQIRLLIQTPCSIIPSRSDGGGFSRASIASGVAGTLSAIPPAADMIEVRLSTRDRWPIASSWAMNPPIDAPTTCAASTPSPSRRAAASSAMSSSA